MSEKQEQLLKLLNEIEKEGGEPPEPDGIDFGEFRKDFLAAVDTGKARRMLALEEKNSRLYAKKEQALIRQGKEIKGRVVAADLKARIEECGRSLKEMIENKMFCNLAALFEDYYRVQLSPDFIGSMGEPEEDIFCHPVLIELDDETFLAAVMTLLYTEQFYSADRILQIREEKGQTGPEMQTVRSDLERFRKAAEHYEKRELQEAEEFFGDLPDRYPENSGFLKFKCRFVMERAQEKQREAERFIGNCLRLFPEDGYFIKYKADLLWMKGSCRNALELYAQARAKTSDPLPLMEMERLLGTCKQEVLDTCERLLEYKAKEEAGQLMELWKNLMPGDEEVKACLCLTKVERARTQGELEAVIREILEKIETSMAAASVRKEGETPEMKQPEQWYDYYKKALTRAWRRLGYPQELAALYTEVKCASEESELEWLAEEIRSHRIKKEMRAEACKLVGDVRMKQGRTKAAFESYRKALELVNPSYIKTELIRIILSDLSRGDKKVRSFAKDSDAAPFLDGWLDKYGTLEDISQMAGWLV